MKKILCILTTFICASLITRAQFSSPVSAYRQDWVVGLEKNLSVYVGYGWKNGMQVAFKHTAIADREDYQNYRLEGSYQRVNPYVTLNTSPFITSDWTISYWNVGVQLSATNQWKSEHVRVRMKYVPFYDNTLHVQHGWAIGAETTVCKEISMIFEYGSIPDYRIAYKRLYAGVEFKVDNLMVKPMFEMPIYDTGLHPSHGRVVVSLSYGLRKQN